MGLTESKCVRLHDEAPLLAEAYTAVRTSGAKEAGFKLDPEPHACIAASGHGFRPSAHAVLDNTGWRVHLHNATEDADKHVCGWRRLGTFWPTRLDGNPTAIDEWTESLKKKLEELSVAQGLPQPALKI